MEKGENELKDSRFNEKTNTTENNSKQNLQTVNEDDRQKLPVQKNSEEEEHIVGEVDSLSDLAQRIDQNKLTEFSQKSLLGNFEQDNQYIISESIAFELTSLNKIITQKSLNECKAYAICGGIKFLFSVVINETLEIRDNLKVTMQTALLQIHETYYKSGEKKDLVTAIARFREVLNPNFFYTVKKVFNLITEEEAFGKNFSISNEQLAPLTLASFRNKFYQYEIKRIQKENAEINYIKALIKILRDDKNGDEIINNFIKQTNFGSKQIEKKVSPTELKSTLEKLIEIAIEKELLSKLTVLKINEVRKKFELDFKGGKQKGAPTEKVDEKNLKSSSAGKNKGVDAGKNSKSKGKSGSKDGSKKGKDKKKDKKDKKEKEELFSVEEFLKNFGKESGLKKVSQAKTPPTSSFNFPTTEQKEPPEQVKPQADKTAGKYSERINFRFENLTSLEKDQKNLNKTQKIEVEKTIIYKQEVERTF